MSVLCHQKNLFVCVYVYKWLILALKHRVSVIRAHRNDDVNKILLKLLCISDIEKGWTGKNIYDLTDKEIKGKYMVKNMNKLTKPQIRKV